jgi:hypothetical protein
MNIRNIRSLLAGGWLLAFCSTCWAVSVPVQFTIDPSASNLNMDISATLVVTRSDSDSTPISGTIDALVDLGTTAPLPPTAGLSLTGGRMYADESLDFSFHVILLVDVDVLIENVSATFRTPGPRGTMSLVGPDQYQFDLAQHELVVDQGTLTASGSALGDPVDEFYDLSDEPLSGSPDPGQISGTLSLRETGSDAASRSYHADLLVPINLTEVIPLDDAGTIEATVTLSGSLSAAADFTAPLGPPGDYNGDGTVDAADYTVWRDTSGSASDLLADGSGNRAVDQDDFLLWKEHFGETIASGSGAAAGPSGSAPVPEPASGLVWILAAGLTALLFGRCR